MASFLKEELQCRQTQFLSTAGFSNEMKFKSRLPPFSLICIRCRCMFCFWFCSLPLSKFWWYYTLTCRVVPNSYLGSCHPSIDQKISLISLAKCLASLIWEPIFQIHTGSLEFGFKLIVCFSRNFIHRQGRALLTIRRMDKILGKASPSPYSPKNYGSLWGVAFISLSRSCPSLTDLNGWDDTEFASRSSVEWRGIHQWDIRLV